MSLLDVLKSISVILATFAFVALLGLILGVPNPLAVVMSESMVPALNVGDLIILEGRSNISVGDIIAYKILEDGGGLKKGSFVIHRVISLNPIQTKGDANPGQIIEFEKNVSSGQLIGKMLFKVPYVGYPSYWVGLIRYKLSAIG